jgi:xylan 1,4-beta-xylosidase
MRSFVSKTATLILAAIAPMLSSQTPSGPPSNSVITINTRDAGTPFPHFWEQSFGSGRAILSLRQSYRDDLNTVRDATSFKEVRFHGIFMDDVGLYDPNAQTQNPGQAAQAAQSFPPFL